jgi:hypothetical protein
LKFRIGFVRDKYFLTFHSNGCSRNIDARFGCVAGLHELRGLAEQERLASEVYVLIPHSGEWIKGMKFVLAEMGLKKFSGSIVRDGNPFLGLGDRRYRRSFYSLVDADQKKPLLSTKATSGAEKPFPYH